MKFDTARKCYRACSCLPVDLTLSISWPCAGGACPWGWWLVFLGGMTLPTTRPGADVSCNSIKLVNPTLAMSLGRMFLGKVGLSQAQRATVEKPCRSVTWRCHHTQPMAEASPRASMMVRSHVHQAWQHASSWPWWCCLILSYSLHWMTN